jgi:hypothetical protein
MTVRGVAAGQASGRAPSGDRPALSDPAVLPLAVRAVADLPTASHAVGLGLVPPQQHEQGDSS